MSASFLQDADRAASAGDIQQAIDLLEQAANEGDSSVPLWLKVAALYRAGAKFTQAMTAVERALALEPLNFTALLLRASLLQRVGDATAPEAWAHALGQKPEGSLPPQLQSVVAEAERHQEAWLRQREERLLLASAALEERADAQERSRMARFRSNALRRTKVYHSEPTHFHYPELRERELHPRDCFQWIAALEAATDTIAAELDQVMNSERGELVPYIQYEDHMPLDQWRQLNCNMDWTAIHLIQNGELVEANARHCPNTLQLLSGIPQPQIAGSGPNAMFSLLAPHTHIPPHVGVNNARLVCHLPLIVPEGCWFRVGAQTRAWRRGEVLVFDDTIEHEAMNPTDQLRVVLIFDIWHPDLSEVERDAVSAMVGAENTSAPL